MPEELKPEFCKIYFVNGSIFFVIERADGTKFRAVSEDSWEEEAKRISEILRKTIGALRDMTPEEALEEAQRRWGPEDGHVSGYIDYDPWMKKEFRCKVGRYYRLEEESDEMGRGPTFRDAFAAADALEKKP